jgi:hypothetical protein
MQSNEVTIEDTDENWQSSPITNYSGTIDQIRKYVPEFERRPFALSSNQQLGFESPSQSIVSQGVNPWHNIIVRKPLESDAEETPDIPVGIVSPQYTLLQHRGVIDVIAKAAVKLLNIEPEQIQATMDLTALGERMRFGIYLPEVFNIDNNASDCMKLRLECFNSVEGSTRFWAIVGWLRFVCSNGLIVGNVQTDFRQRHNQKMDIAEISAVLEDGLNKATADKKVFSKWMEHKVSSAQIEDWVNGHVAKQWGVKAAVRAWHITKTGFDVSLADPFEKGKPTEKTVIKEEEVPGSILPSDNVFAVSQTLSWLAKERRDIQEQLLWKQQIPQIVNPLLKQRAA